MFHCILAALLAASLLIASAAAQDIQDLSGVIAQGSTWTPPHAGGGSGSGSRSGSRSTNCQSLGSGCKTCTYRAGGRGLLADDLTTALTAAAARSTWRGVSYGGSVGTINPWVGVGGSGWTSSGGSSSGSGSGGSSGSGSSGTWTCNSCDTAANFKLTKSQSGARTCGELQLLRL